MLVAPSLETAPDELQMLRTVAQKRRYELYAVGACHDRLYRVNRLVHAAGDSQRSTHLPGENREPPQPQQKIARVL